MAVGIYTICTPITTGCYLYSDPCLSLPVSNGVYSDGTNCFTVTGGLGLITSQSLCDPYYYYNATQYDCNNCGGSSTGSAILRFTVDPTAFSWFADGLGNTYQKGSATTYNPSFVNADSFTQANSCINSCQ